MGSKTADTRIGVLKVLRNWLEIGGGVQDVLDDPGLYTSFDNFLSESSQVSTRDASSGHPGVLAAWFELRKAFRALLSHPPWTSGDDVLDQCGDDPVPRIFGISAPQLDSASAEELVDNLDSVALSVMSLISSSDLLAASDLLEVQLSERGLCPNKDVSASSEDVESETFHSMLMEAEMSRPLQALYSGKTTFIQTLPSSVQRAIKLHEIIRDWTITKICAIGIRSRTREDRISLILRAVEICQNRGSTYTFPKSGNGANLPGSPSLVESALLSALWGRESRIYARAWANIAVKRNASHESFQTLLQKSTHKFRNSVRSSLDCGWILEQLVQVLSLKDRLPRNDHMLINFDKRRCVALLH